MMDLLRLVERGHVEKVEEYIMKNGVPTDSKWSDYLLLRFAVRRGHLGITKFLIEQGCRVNKTVQSPLNTLLHIATEEGYVEIIRLLLEKGASTERKNHNGDTPLTLDIKTIIKEEYVNQDLLSILLENGADINTRTTAGTTLLHIAVKRLDVEMVKRLIQLKANVNSIDKLNGAPLHLAVECRNIHTANLLLEHGADLNLKKDNGQTPLHVAVQNMDKVMIDHLILWSQCNFPKFENHVDDFGFTHFQAACISNNVKLVSTFLDNGQEVNQSVKEDSPEWPLFTPLHFALEEKCEETVKLLLEHGANINPTLNTTTLHLAVQYMSKDVVATILEGGANVNACTNSGITPLHIAAQRGDLEIAKLLIKYKADVNWAEEINQETPLHFAVQRVQFEVVQLLLSKGADVHAKTSNDEIALHFMTPTGVTELEFVEPCSKIIKSFLDAGCDINTLDARGYTPLCTARAYSSSSSAYALLQHGADINLMNKNEKNSPELSKIFNEHTVKLRILKNSVNNKKPKIEDNALYDTCVDDDFVQRCVDELNRMRGFHVDRYTSLYRIIFKSSSEMAVHVLNESFKKTLESQDFDKSFPLYGYLIRLQFRKGTTALPLLSPAKYALDISTKLGLPDCCSTSILKYLSNEDLKNLISATN